MAESSGGKNTVNKFWLTVAALSGVPFIMVLGNSMLIPVLPDIRNALNLTPVQVSLLITMFSLPAGIIIPLAGFLSDRFNRKTIIIPALIIYGAGGAIAAFAGVLLKQHVYAVILAGRVLQGIGAAGTAPIAMALCGDLFQGKERSRSLGAIESSNGMGKVVSPVLGSAIGLIAWYAAFIFFPMIIIPVVIGVWLLVKEPGNKRAKQKLAEYLKSFLNIFKSKKGFLLSSYLAGAVALMILFGVLFYLSEYLERQFDLDGIKKGLALAIPVLFMSAVSFTTGFIIKKKNKLMRILIIAGLSIMAASLIFLPFAGGAASFFVAISIIGASTGMVLPCLNTLVTGAAPIEERGLVISFYGSVRFLGVAIGPPVYGYLMDRGTGLMFWSSGGLALLGAAFVLLFTKTSGEKTEGLALQASPARKPQK